jgi:hypothetical protein
MNGIYRELKPARGDNQVVKGAGSARVLQLWVQPFTSAGL